MPTFSCYFMKEYLAACSYNVILATALLLSAPQPEPSLPQGQNLPVLWRLLQAQRTPSSGGSLTEEILHTAKIKYHCL